MHAPPLAFSFGSFMAPPRRSSSAPPRSGRSASVRPRATSDAPSQPQLRVGTELQVEGTDAFEKGATGAFVGPDRVRVVGLLPGEAGRARVTHVDARGIMARLTRVERPSADRVTPACPHYGVCGGCDLQHLSYPAQLAHKANIVRQALREAIPAGLLQVRDTIGAPEPWGQRTRIGVQVGGAIGDLKPCFFKSHSHDLVPITECAVQDPLGTKMMFRIFEIASALRISPWREKEHKGVFRALLIRTAPGTERVHVVVIVARPDFPQRDAFVQAIMDAGADGVSLNIHRVPGHLLLGPETLMVAGHARLHAQVRGAEYVMSPGAFFQTSRFGLTTLIDQVRLALEDLPNTARVLDLYCGVGLFTLSMAPRVSHVTGVEENRAAITDARIAAKLRNVENVTFIAGSAEGQIKSLAKDRERRPDAVIIDPPREGCHPAVLRCVGDALRPRRVVYVSCDPQSLGRDAALLAASGYKLRWAQPLDMFPHVSHVETVAVFDRDTSALVPQRTSGQRRRDKEAPPVEIPFDARGGKGSRKLLRRR